MDDATLTMLRAFMDFEFSTGDGAKELRFFTAADLRAFAESSIDAGTPPHLLRVADAIENACVVTAGELLARMEGLMHAAARIDDEEFCPRCNFEFAIRDVAQFGGIVEEQFERGEYALTGGEQKILALCREWDVDDTIRRCVDES